MVRGRSVYAGGGEIPFIQRPKEYSDLAEPGRECPGGVCTSACTGSDPCRYSSGKYINKSGGRDKDHRFWAGADGECFRSRRPGRDGFFLRGRICAGALIGEPTTAGQFYRRAICAGGLAVSTDHWEAVPC